MPDRRLGLLTLALLIAAAGYLGWGLSWPVWFILELRAEKLTALILIGVSIGASTVAFQTIAASRILTPSIMGLDALYLLIQTGLLASLGGIGYATTPPTMRFLVDGALLVGFALLLFGPLLRLGGDDIQRLLLAGVVLGVFFRSVTTFLQRLMDPSEFAMIQGAMFASFGAPDPDALVISLIVGIAACAILLTLSSHLDALALGRNAAIPLGVSVDALARAVLALTALLTATATALVGPVAFLGLLAASLAHASIPDHRHSRLMSASGLIAALVLVLGQLVFERLLALQSTLSIIIEFVGGLFFIYLVLSGRAR